MRFDRCSKLVLGSAVALVGIRMVHFEPFLIAAFYFLRCRIRRKTECLKCLCFQHFEFAYLEISLLRLALRGGLRAFNAFAEPERTVDGSGVSEARLTLVPRSDGRRWPLPLIAGNILVRQIRREIIPLVILLHVLKTEEQI